MALNNSNKITVIDTLSQKSATKDAQGNPFYLNLDGRLVTIEITTETDRDGSLEYISLPAPVDPALYQASIPTAIKVES